MQFYSVIIKYLKFIHKFFNIIKKIFFNSIFLILLSSIIIFLYNIPYNNLQKINLKKKVVLKIELHNPLQEEYTPIKLSHNKIKKFFQKKIFNFSSNSVYEIIQKIKQAKNDPKISGIILDFNKKFSGNRTSIEYLGKILKNFKSSGKPIFSISKNYDQNQYYLASFSNEIILLPHGSVTFQGISIKKLYFKKFLKFFRIHTHIFRIGRHKTAVEPYIRNTPSKISKKNDLFWMNYIWKKFILTIIKNRKIKKKLLFPNTSTYLKILKKFNCNLTKIAKRNNLIDHVYSYKNLNKKFIKIFGKDKKNNTYNQINLKNYIISHQEKKKNYNKIAIIFAIGEIENNIHNKNSMKISEIIKRIEYIKNNPTIKAIILRINSPGGSAFFSEILRKKLLSIRKLKKPIIISMGDITASGGYWMSMAGDYLIAHPTTLTGSIGIFSIINTFEKTLKKFGISQSYVSIKKSYDSNHFRNLTSESKKFINFNIKRGYNEFIKLVAKSRNKKNLQIHQIAQGQIWTGLIAKKIGLIDQLGDFDTALKKAAELSNLKNYEIDWPIQHENIFNILKNKFFDTIKIFFTNISHILIPRHIQKIILKFNIISDFFNYIFFEKKNLALCINCKFKM